MLVLEDVAMVDVVPLTEFDAVVSESLLLDAAAAAAMA